jgi:hypothetical protein
MSNVTPISDYIIEIRKLENVIIEKDKVIMKNKEEMDILQETFKNLILQVNQVLETIK